MPVMSIIVLDFEFAIIAMLEAGHTRNKYQILFKITY